MTTLDGTGSGPAVHVRNHETDCTARALSAGMMIRANIAPIAPNAPPGERQEQERAAGMGHRYRDMSMLDICREAIRLDGRGQTLPHARQDQIREAVSGGTLTGIFTAVVNAALMASYAESADSTVGWVREADISDFKTAERIRIGKAGSLTRHHRGDEADHAAPSDNKEEYKIARYSKQFAVDEQDIIDDRLDALRDMPEIMGRAARRLRPDLVYAILLANAALADGVLLFATAHGNYATSGSALAAATLEAGIATMAKQTEDDVNINVEARHLIVPQDLRFSAAVLLQSAQRIIASASGGTFNPLQDLDIQLHADNRLGAAGVTDPATGTAHTGSATNWFLAASPLVAPTIEVGYLAGTNRAPVLRSFALVRGQWGVSFDIKMDIGAKALDHRGMYKATGES